MLAQADPFREFDSFLGRWMAGGGTAGTSGAMDAYRRGNDVWVHVDLPGVAADSIDVSVERGLLTIAAERTWHREEHDRVYLAERTAGRFRRQIRLGDGLDLEHIEADYHDGVLTLRIPVGQQAQPRKVAINAHPTAIEATASS
jgi:HSP20 family protein